MTRRGVALPELLVALALGGVVMATALRGVTQHVRWRRDRDAQARAEWAARDVLAVLRAELSHGSGAPVVLGDTALQLSSVRAFDTACDVSAGRPVLASAAWSAPRAGDSLAVIDSLLRTEWRAAIAAVGVIHASARCPSGGMRITPTAALPVPAVPMALPVRVWRVARYVLYRGGDGSWWLGERGCTPICGAAQPVAGPLLPPPQGGLRMTMRLDADGRPQAVDVSVRALVGGRIARLSARIPVAP